MFRLVGIALAALVLVGCGTSQKPYQPASVPSGKAVIYVYAQRGLIFNDFKGLWFVNVDGKSIGRLGQGIHYAIPVAPGEHTLTFNDGNPIGFLLGGDKHKVQARAGGSYYYRVIQEMVTPTAPRIYLRPVPAAVGKAEIQQTRPG